MKTSVIYVRVASKDEYTSTIQEEQLKLFAVNHNIDVKKVFVDNGYSGTNFNRPAFQEMLDYIKSNDIDVILVKSLDRISRNILDAINFINDMKELDIEVFSLDEGNLFNTLCSIFEK